VKQIETLTDVSDSLATLSELEQTITALKVQLEERITKAKTTYSDQVSPFVGQRDALTKALKKWATENKKAHFSVAKSKAFPHGRIGFRKSSKVTTTKRTLGLLVERGVAIRTKHDIDKTALATWTDEQLKEVGAKHSRSETFFIDLEDTVLPPGQEGGSDE